MTPQRRPLRQAVPRRHARASRSATGSACCSPSDDDNYYRERDLVPADLWDALLAGADRDHELPHLPAPGRQGDPGRRQQHPQAAARRQAARMRPVPGDAASMVAARVLRDVRRGQGRDRRAQRRGAPLLPGQAARAARRRGRQGGRGAQRATPASGSTACRRSATQGRASRPIYDLSATPYYLKGSGYNEGYIFPWMVSDFSLMDAIESGIVKVPRIPVDDDAAGDQLVYLQPVGPHRPPLPEAASRQDARRGAELGAAQGRSKARCAACTAATSGVRRTGRRTLARARRAAAGDDRRLPEHDRVEARLRLDRRARRSSCPTARSVAHKPGNLPLLSQRRRRQPGLARPRTILIDSAQLESGEALKADFKKAAAREIEAFKQSYRLRNPGADVDKLTDADLLREVMNTVGKKGKLGEHIRCVVSRRRCSPRAGTPTPSPTSSASARSAASCCASRSSAAACAAAATPSNDDGPLRARVRRGLRRAVRVHLRPTSRSRTRAAQAGDRGPRASTDREDLRITFPKLDGYRVELPDERLHADFDDDSALAPRPRRRSPLWVEMRRRRRREPRRSTSTTSATPARSESRSRSPRRMLERASSTPRSTTSSGPGCSRSWSTSAGEWLDECVTTDAGVTHRATCCSPRPAPRRREGLRRDRPARPATGAACCCRCSAASTPHGSTDDVRLLTRKVVMDPPPTKSHLNHVVLDGMRRQHLGGAPRAASSS